MPHRRFLLGKQLKCIGQRQFHSQPLLFKKRDPGYPATHADTQYKQEGSCVRVSQHPVGVKLCHACLGPWSLQTDLTRLEMVDRALIQHMRRDSEAVHGDLARRDAWIGRAPTARDELRLAAETDFSRRRVTRTLKVFEPGGDRKTWSGSAPGWDRWRTTSKSYMSPSCRSKILRYIRVAPIPLVSGQRVLASQYCGHGRNHSPANDLPTERIGRR